MFDIAPKFKANVIFAEHRYYGKSLPLGSDSFKSANVGFLTIEQTLADYAVLIHHLKETLNASNSPVIAFGGSYGGMLAAYFRFKYPNIVDGSIAASAPIFLVAGKSPREYFFEDITSHFTNAAEGCGIKVKDAFFRMQALVKMGPKGLASISKSFNLCSPMKSDSDYAQLIGWIRNSFAQLAMMDYPYPTNFISPLPGWPVKKSCQLLLGASDPIGGLAKASKLVYGTHTCTDMWKEYVACADPTGCGLGFNSYAWDYQACTEVLMPAGTNNVTDFFPVLPFTVDERKDYCQKRWNITPNNDWIGINLWGRNIESATNIVFSNGDLDPWHRGGVLTSVSDSVIAVVIKDGAHHLDLRSSNAKDPKSVIQARQIEVSNIQKWIDEARKRNALKLNSCK